VGAYRIPWEPAFSFHLVESSAVAPKKVPSEESAGTVNGDRGIQADRSSPTAPQHNRATVRCRCGRSRLCYQIRQTSAVRRYADTPIGTVPAPRTQGGTGHRVRDFYLSARASAGSAVDVATRSRRRTSRGTSSSSHGSGMGMSNAIREGAAACSFASTITRVPSEIARVVGHEQYRRAGIRSRAQISSMGVSRPDERCYPLSTGAITPPRLTSSGRFRCSKSAAIVLAKVVPYLEAPPAERHS